MSMDYIGSFVLAHVDEAANNVVFVWIKNYIIV